MLTSLFLSGKEYYTLCINREEIMTSLLNVPTSILQNTKNVLANIVRNASKKQGGSTRNTSPKSRPKHRGVRVQDGHAVTAGTILATQRNLRFHPGLNVGLGRNGTLFAIIPGRVMITCEKTDPNWDHTWVQRCHGYRQGTDFFKKYFNVLPERQHQNFNLIDQV